MYQGVAFTAQALDPSEGNEQVLHGGVVGREKELGAGAASGACDIEPGLQEPASQALTAKGCFKRHSDFGNFGREMHFANTAKVLMVPDRDHQRVVRLVDELLQSDIGDGMHEAQGARFDIQACVMGEEFAAQMVVRKGAFHVFILLKSSLGLWPVILEGKGRVSKENRKPEGLRQGVFTEKGASVGAGRAG
jgi:hypothetical protein